MNAGFALDPRLAADTHPIAQWPLCDVLLMDDARYPWLILVPRVAGARELIDLDEATRMQLRKETDAACECLRNAMAPDKLNVAALGNVVDQLHVHVIARYREDDAWPKPVWGVHPATPRSDEARKAIIDRIHGACPLFAFEENQA